MVEEEYRFVVEQLMLVEERTDLDINLHFRLERQSDGCELLPEIKRR
jgi:hypothetical protein